MKYTYLINYGHGGIINEVYQTPPEKGKQFEHTNGQVAYEGVINRIIGRKLVKKLKDFSVPYIEICPTELDIPLPVRAGIVNKYHQWLHNCILLEIHSNAGHGTGIEIWTSVGNTPADPIANQLYLALKRTIPEVKYRIDQTDGDYDKERDFYMLTNTNCPAVLPELMFFDNWKDYKLLMNEEFQNRIIDAFILFINKLEQ